MGKFLQVTVLFHFFVGCLPMATRFLLMKVLTEFDFSFCRTTQQRKWSGRNIFLGFLFNATFSKEKFWVKPLTGFFFQERAYRPGQRICKVIWFWCGTQFVRYPISRRVAPPLVVCHWLFCWDLWIYATNLTIGVHWQRLAGSAKTSYSCSSLT